MSYFVTKYDIKYVVGRAVKNHVVPSSVFTSAAYRQQSRHEGRGDRPQGGLGVRAGHACPPSHLLPLNVMDETDR